MQRKSRKEKGIHRLAFIFFLIGIGFSSLCGCSKKAENNTLPSINISDDEVSSEIMSSSGTLPGANEIYPTIMVNDLLYEWRMGRAIRGELPNECVYYGEVTHTEGTAPKENGEFVSVFDASGSIYVTSEDSSVIYLVLTTEWMTETVVTFDLVTE